MTRYGLVRAIALALRPTDVSAFSIRHVPVSSLAANGQYTWPVPPGSTQLMQVDSTGLISFVSAGGGGSVTSVGLSLPSLFSVSGSPVTTSGTLTATFASQTANTFLAAPNGSTGAPTMRALVSADIPKTLDNSWITDFNTQVRLSRLDQMAAPTAAVSFNGQRLASVADATLGSDAPSWQQVQALFNGQDNKASVRVASTANVTVSSAPATIDGITLAANNRVLLKNQTTAAENGIYTFTGAALPLTRATDADTAAEFTTGLNVFVEEGTQAATLWFLNTPGPITLGTTGITFTQIGGGAAYTAGNGLSLASNQFSVLGTANRIAVSGAGVDIASTYVGQSSITTLGTITTGTWNGTTIALANGGTGSTTASGARTNLGVPGIFRQAFTSANITGGILTVTHNLGQQFVGYQIYDNNNKAILPDDETATSTTVLTVDVTNFGTITGTWNIVVWG